MVTAVDQPFPGVNITPATATFTVINPNSLYFKSEIDQEEITQVTPNQSAIVSLDSFPDKTIDSAITYISFIPIAGESSTVYEIRFQLPLDNQDLDYRLGMDGEAVITLDQSDQALTVPLEAVYEDDQKYVWRKVDNQVLRQNITTGIESDTDIEVLSGLSLNDQIIIKRK